MHWEDFIGQFLAVIGSVLIYSYINAQAKKESAPNEDGIHELQLNKLYKILGVIFLIIGILPICCWALTEEGSIFYVSFNLSIVFLTISGGFGLVMLLFYENHFIRFDDDEIFISSWTKKETTFSWNEIEKISFNSLSSNITIKSFDKVGKINYQMVGLREFIKVMEAKTQWTAKELKLPIN